MDNKSFLQEKINDKVFIHHGIIKARWVLIAGLGILGIFLRTVSQNDFLLNLNKNLIAGLILIAVFYNTLYHLYLRRPTKCTPKGLSLLALLQVVPDIIIFTIITYFSGGIQAVSFIFYLYSITIASALFSGLGILLTVLLTIVSYTLVISLEYYQIIPHLESYADKFATFQFQNYAFTFVVYTTVIFALAVAGAFSSIIAQLLARRNELIKTERDRVDSIIGHLPNAIILINNNHEITFANQKLFNLVGLPKEKIIKLKLNKTTLKNDPRYKIIYQIFFPSEKYRVPSLKQKYEITIADKEVKILKIETVLVMGKGQQMLGFMKIIHDVTREQAIDKMKSEFISIAAHQLRTPLSAIKWSLKMVLDGDLGKIPQEVDKFIDKSYQTNERMIRLVNDLLNVSRIEEGRFMYRFKPLNLISLLDNIINEFKHLADEKNIILKWSPPLATIPLINGDEDRLRLAIQNLLDNALKYTLKGHLKISLEKLDGSNIKLSIADSGFGIPPEERHRIFTKFYRGNNALKQQTEGSGLGLFIVKNIIDKHNAKIDFTSSNQGTVFNIYFIGLPLNEEQNLTKDNFKKFLTEF